jgi:hypothetical protein
MFIYIEAFSRLPIGAWYYQVNQSGSPSFGKFQKMK